MSQNIKINFMDIHEMSSTAIIIRIKQMAMHSKTAQTRCITYFSKDTIDNT